MERNPSAFRPWAALRRHRRAVLVFAGGLVPVVLLSRLGTADLARYGVSVTQTQLGQLLGTVAAFGGGIISGILPVVFAHLLRKAPDVAVALGALVLLYAVLVSGVGAGVAVASGGIGFWTGLAGAWLWLFGLPRLPRPTTFGSAEWADYDHIEAAGFLAGRGFRLGTCPVPGPRQKRDGIAERTIRYGGDRHLLTVAPTRAGKGVSAVIPNLLTYPGSALVIDVKGELARITAIARHRLGQSIYLVDPWGIVTGPAGLRSARFNPLDLVVAGDPDLAENAMLVADALVVTEAGAKDRFWDEEAKSLMVGLIAFVATDRAERERRHLGRVRDILTMGTDDLKGLFQRMCLSDVPLVRSTGERGLQKEPKLLANVLATTQAHTHFLESPRIRDSLAASDFRFDGMKAKGMTIYLILPADRLNTFGQWLRLLIQQAITVNARNVAQRPEHSILFMLDEMAALGRLASVEQAYSLMAGFGMQLWGIVQDFSQLERIYGASGWQTFIANAGAIQYLGSRDEKTAGYVSKLCGVATILSLSTALSQGVTRAVKGSSSTESTTRTRSEAQRSLAYPDELMRLPKDRQILLLENANPINAGRIVWYADPRLKSLGVDLAAVRRQQT
ncbi:type IV secretion system protein VirD4 [Rhodobium orientis]|uniref:Conjugal transfer protein TraG n=1 Tax=Rhodobium orientis TaxID=34017 RepID=A0A327JH14_9HYPH|nr:type IV secretory system conjugative DNA transfer family protein [Rhodobium orientis]MBB4305683.1 type IV secretion system protein VirD4 [Rhodobium orientis]MBK5948423.1 hypothetical protein [Rhodobium orientis]RAI24603.1 hypothetical protein CH339_21925 [Rhodobium orientis]